MRKNINTRPECCGLKSLKTADDCPYGLACLTGLNCVHRKKRDANSNMVNKPRQKKNPRKPFKSNKHKKKK